MNNRTNRSESRTDAAPSGDSGNRPTSKSLNVAVIDDDPNFVEALSANLSDHGFVVQRFTDSALALEHLVGGADCDAILLDWYMPRLNGAAFLKLLRDAGIATPVIVMTANGNDSNEDTALGFGAIDFIEKSRRVSILVKRLNLIAGGNKAQIEAPEPDELIIGELSLRMKSGRAVWRGLEVDLTFTEFRIVEMLAGRAGTDLTYREIYDVVHGEGFWAGDGNTGYRVNVRSLIKRIRQKFQRIDPDFNEIENYPGYGYRWRSVTSGALEDDESDEAESGGDPPVEASPKFGSGDVRRVTA